MMFTSIFLLLALAHSCFCDEPRNKYEEELQKGGVDLNKLHAEFSRESAEVEKEFSAKETKEEMARLVADYKAANQSPADAASVIFVPSEIDINGAEAADLFQGDIKLTPAQWKIALDVDPSQPLIRRQAITEAVRFWQPIGAPVIPYSFATGFPEDKKKVVTDAMALWEAVTCATYRPSTANDKNVLVFNHNSTRCCSHAGVIGGKQELDLAPGCFSVTLVAHELSHAFGTMHVQCRFDRDKFVSINDPNVNATYKHNFVRDPINYGVLSNYGIPYEFGSLQHYHHAAFALDKSVPTILALPQYQRYQKSMESPRASFYDTLLINTLYKCTDKCKEKLQCDNFGVQHGKDCKKCFCPKGWAGTTCDKRPADAQIEKMSADGQFKMYIAAGSDSFKEHLAIVEAPAGKRIKAKVAYMSYDYSSCRTIGIEIIPTEDTRISGYKHCGPPDGSEYESDKNSMLFYLYNEAKTDMNVTLSIKIV